MVTLRKHQVEGIDFILNTKFLGSLLWHGMGLGKTLSALTATRHILSGLRLKGVQNPKFLVVMPKSAATTWRAQCMEHSPDLWRQMVMLPYSRLHEAARLVMYHDIRVLICDESHYLKNPESGRAEEFVKMLELMSGSKGKFEGGKVIFLTGTPMLNHAAEFYSTWAVLASPNIFEASLRLKCTDRYKKWTASFSKKRAQEWTVFKGIGKDGKKIEAKKQGIKQEGVENSGLMNQLISPIVHFRRVTDCLDLPAKNEVSVDLNIPDDKLLIDADIEKPEAYMALVERLSRAKAPHLITWVEEFIKSNNEQLVVFSMHVDPLYTLQTKFPKDVVIITGAENSGERDANVVSFQNNRKRVIAMSYLAGSESLNLQNCNYAVYCGYPWTDGRLKQAMARIWRQGQQRPTFHYFLTSGENDRRVLRLVRSKEEATTEVEDLLLVIQKNEITWTNLI